MVGMEISHSTKWAHSSAKRQSRPHVSPLALSGLKRRSSAKFATTLAASNPWQIRGRHRFTLLLLSGNFVCRQGSETGTVCAGKPDRFAGVP